ncbi:hypothetical protein EVAR_102304_1 [Eumeta japonica]|uniref:Uncharacterized protein n=1 Tax=Eumeta variegata TaxID=151549 RepID=A0A4C1WJQ0_EUMVA|nr:hypothetical protein EVAR_102304_1 [Eumeta japonica]
MNSGVTPEWVAPGAGRPRRPPLATPLLITTFFSLNGFDLQLFTPAQYKSKTDSYTVVLCCRRCFDNLEKRWPNMPFDIRSYNLEVGLLLSSQNLMIESEEN